MKRVLPIALALFCTAQLAVGAKQTPIDRRALVSRHTITTTKINAKSPAQVGNGEFAFGVDITGLQTFVPFNTMAQWSWHSFPLPEGMKASDFKKTKMDVHGVMKEFYLPNPEQPELSAWLANNPHRFNLGRIGMRLLKADGTEAVAADLTQTRQVVDLWKGIITSSFELEGIPVKVLTACDPKQDALGITIESELIRKGQLSVFVDFPYADNREFADYVGRYDSPQKHRSIVTRQNGRSALIAREMDDVRYYTALQWSTPARLIAPASGSSHRFLLEPMATDKLTFTSLFSQKETTPSLTANQIYKESARCWKAFWQSGAAIDLSQSKDPRWKELERRIVLSQYVLKVNEAGSLPPQESGLVNNGWNGRFHFEMIWWHGVHYALWNRWPLLEKSLSVYADFLPTSQQRAADQGYKGARWPKCTAGFDREWPHLIHATLIWQQPHPIFFAALDYRLHPTQKTLDKWKDIVFATADYMADFAFYDASKKEYVLGPPITIVSENTKQETTSNPTFELGYWRYGLRVAQEWRKRLSLTEEKKWGDVLAKLAPLPVEDGVYVTHEGIKNMWTDFTFEHPGLTGAYGMLPGDGVDKEVFARTMDKVAATWNFERTWGWDFPMLAMAAARCGKQDAAINYLLHSAGGFQFDEHGLATGGPFPYFPSNGGLLSAIAMMAGGWDGSTTPAPGFPKDENWIVRAENFVPLF